MKLPSLFTGLIVFICSIVSMEANGDSSASPGKELRFLASQFSGRTILKAELGFGIPHNFHQADSFEVRLGDISRSQLGLGGGYSFSAFSLEGGLSAGTGGVTPYAELRLNLLSYKGLSLQAGVGGKWLFETLADDTYDSPGYYYEFHELIAYPTIQMFVPFSIAKSFSYIVFGWRHIAYPSATADICCNYQKKFAEDFSQHVYTIGAGLAY